MVFYLALHASLPVAGIAAAGAYGAGIMIFSTKKKPAALDIRKRAGLIKTASTGSLEKARKKVDRLHKLAGATTGAESRKKVEGLAILAQKIIDDLKEQPGDIKRARQFLNYYLDTTIRILERFTRNQRQKRAVGRGGRFPGKKSSQCSTASTRCSKSSLPA